MTRRARLSDLRKESHGRQRSWIRRIAPDSHDRVVKVYDTGEVPFTALSGVDLDIDAGEFVGLIGKSGSARRRSST